MSFDDLRTGAVISYSYLWERQADDGETEGRKERPSVVGVRMPKPSGDVLVLFAITTKRPAPERWAVEVPEAEKRRVGLDVSLRQWIMLDEANQDVVGRSYYLTAGTPLGYFSAKFFGPIVQEVIRRWREIHRISRR
ncbi:MAG TPA: hypothetical protein VGV07_05365 [Devosia sp.]|jgi:hypothetical protein|uniref:hypothetical protein n=1 Tax=Devosia sp. TaxID=1871048 RepID=UPI002DDCC2CE|nr:hypothetical protein [Devosia sp.]HEV2514655.1 hypothetical protein [Devosia sp.]